MKNIATALVAAQTEMSNPIKDRVNPFFKNSYADLNSVREATIPILNKHGISVLQPMVHVDGKNFVKTVLLHTSGEVVESLTEIIYGKQNDAQSQGSGITYARRYSLQAMVCVGADDDDGNAASNPQTNQSTTGGDKKEDKPALPWLNKSDAPSFANVVKAMREGYKIADVRKKWSVSKATEKELEDEVNKPA